MASEEAGWSFMVEWHDNQAQITRTFSLTYYPASRQLEMVRVVLRPPHAPSLCLVPASSYARSFFFARLPSLYQFDPRQRKVFLKRCSYPAVTADDLFLGNTITVYSRQLQLVSYADQSTRLRLEKTRALLRCA